MSWLQNPSPLGGIALSAAAAAVPLVVVFICLALLRMKVHQAAGLGLASALAAATLGWSMPLRLSLLAALQGAAFGLFPVFFIVLASLFLYNLTVAGGQFEQIRASIAGLTPDRRIQALLIAFCFGAFIEGAAGFGAPVAIAGATLVGLGFEPLYAAGLCLVANTAPVAFGTIGIPIVAMGGVIGLGDAGLMRLSAMVGHQLPFISVILPLYLVLIMSGWRGALGALPAVAVCGLSFAGCQWATATFLGPYLPDLIASLASMIALAVLLRFWRPRRVFRFASDPPTGPQSARMAPVAILRAWAPYLALTSLVLLWGLPSVKAGLGRATVVIPVPGLDNAVARPGPAGPVPLQARYKFDYLASGGSAVLIAALISSRLCGVRAGATARILARTLRDLRLPALSFAFVLALAYVMNASGMTVCLGTFATHSGRAFPLLSPVLGWLGVFLTGSDTSSNVLFGGLQKTAAEQLGLNPILTAAANTSGGVLGKMISPQSLAVACAATGRVGDEGLLLRRTLGHSLLFLSFMSLLVYLQAFYLVGMVPA